MGHITEEEKENMRNRGLSDHDIAYYDADSQKEYEPLLKDPTTPAELIDRIVDSLTMLPLKLLAYKHPNISFRSQRYMLEKAYRKPYHKDIIEALLDNPKQLLESEWVKFRKYFNASARFDIFVMELMEEQKDFFTTEKLSVIFNAFAETGARREKMIERYLLAIFEHKNFDVSIVDDKLFREDFIFNSSPILNAINATKNKEAISLKIYEITGDDGWLPQAAKDIFLF